MRESILYDVEDAKVYPITARGDGDTPPTYGTMIDVPGISSVELSPNYESNTLNGDGGIIDTRTKLQSLGLSFGYGKLAPDVLSALDGGSVIETAEGVHVYRREASDRIPYFGFAGLVREVDSDTGSAILVCYFAKIDDGTLFGASSNSYGEPSFSATAQRTPHGLLWDARLAETAEELPADLADFVTLTPAT